MFLFDANGFLMPAQIAPATLAEVEEVFVEHIPYSKTRRVLFNNYLRYIHEFRNKVTRNFTQWINGSFISQKENPNDIDFVTFLDYEIYEAHERFLDKFWTFSLESEGLDAYLVEVYPKEHEKYTIYQSNIERYRGLYGKTTLDEQGIRLPKGFIELKFS